MTNDSHTITGVSTGSAAFVDVFMRGPIDTAVRISDLGEFEEVFGGLDATSEASYGVRQFFLNGGRLAWVVRVAAAAHDETMAGIVGSEAARTGIFALDRLDPFAFNILCLPAMAALDDQQARELISIAERYCQTKRAFLIVDVPARIDSAVKMTAWMQSNDGLRHPNAAVYFPRLEVPDPPNGNRPRIVSPSGTLAGVYARTDAARGVWKAPAGADAELRGASPAVSLTPTETAALNPLAINALKKVGSTSVSWGARTLLGADQMASEWKYIPVRRTALYIEGSLEAGLRWAASEPNDEALWAAIRLSVSAFMDTLFRDGALQGRTPSEAYFVKCDRTTTTQDEINQGIVNITVGFAPLKPAEFVLIRLQQIAGQSS